MQAAKNVIQKGRFRYLYMHIFYSIKLFGSQRSKKTHINSNMFYLTNMQLRATVLAKRIISSISLIDFKFALKEVPEAALSNDCECNVIVEAERSWKIIRGPHDGRNRERGTHSHC